MGASPLPALLADTASSLQNFVRVFVWIYILLIFAYVLMSWVRLPYSGRPRLCNSSWTKSVVRTSACSGRLPTLGPLDVSPIIAVVVLLVAPSSSSS